MDELVRACRNTIAEGSKSFALAATLFDRRTRARAYLLYAWCRYCDDVIDGQTLGHGKVESDAGIDERLDYLTRMTGASLAGETTGTVPFDALARFAAETRLPARYPFELIEGFAMDARERSYRCFTDTLDYCYHVAGVVGGMMAIAMGVRPDDVPTLERAADLGIAFQLVNIARDVCEDDRRGRCYLPDEWLAAEDIAPGEHAKPYNRAALARVVARLVDEAERYQASARYGTPVLPLRAAWAVLAAAGIYGDIGRRVRVIGDQAWHHRTTVSTTAKLLWVMRSSVDALRRSRWRAAPPRDALWTKQPGASWQPPSFATDDGCVPPQVTIR